VLEVADNDTAYATWEDVQKGFEKPIPAINQPVVTEFLVRASRRLRMMKGKLAAALVTEGPESDLAGFVKDMVVDAAERKLRNPGGFSHENAGVFSISRYDDFAKGRITFDPTDLALIDEYIDETLDRVVRGPIKIGLPAWRIP
jgi:hypothetical protein